MLSGVDEATVHAVTPQMDPFPPLAGDAPGADHVRLEEQAEPAVLTELQRPAGDGLVTATAGRGIRIVMDGRSCTVPDPLGDDPPVFALDPGFAAERLIRPFVKPALQLSLLRHERAAVHATAIERDGRAILVGGWSESGKTEVALALLEQEGSFLSDKWAVVGGDGVTAFPMPVGIRRWVLPYLPRLRRALPARHRAQLGLAGAAGAALRPLRRSGSRPVVAAGTVVALAERASLRPSELSAAYGQRDDPARRVPLGTLVLLATVPDGPIEVRELDPAEAARRLAESGAYERRQWSALAERARHLRGTSAPPSAWEAAERERGLLTGLLAEATVVEVAAPFPADPRVVAEALAGRL